MSVGLIVVVFVVFAVLVWQRATATPWTRYEDPAGRFTVEHPPGAEIEETGAGDEVTVSFSIDAGTLVGMALIVAPSRAPDGISAEAVAESEESGPAGGGATVLSVAEPFSIAGTTGYRNITDGPNWRREEVYVDHDGEVLVFVSLSGDETVDAQEITQRFFSSVELEG